MSALLPAPPADYDPIANNGYLGAHKLYLALLPTLTAAQAQTAGVVLDDLAARMTADFERFAAACEAQRAGLSRLAS